MNQNEFSRAADGHAIALLTHAMRFTHDEDDAKDLVQDTLIKGIRFCAKFDKGTNLRGWLYVIMRNTFINDYRKAQKRHSVISRDEDLSSPNLLKSSTKISSEGKFVMDDIQKALQSLPEQYRIPFQRYFEGYKYEEIAEERGIPLGTVKTHIHQARQILKTYLKQYRPV
ncbi:RNA polymerase sigma factor [Pedobacter terrae]|uniref:RNA polymerase sigma factor n=1 Tax=Pedobacter terrae TaxID=405671 RepID=UPI002FFA3B2B